MTSILLNTNIIFLIYKYFSNVLNCHVPKCVQYMLKDSLFIEKKLLYVSLFVSYINMQAYVYIFSDNYICMLITPMQFARAFIIIIELPSSLLLNSACMPAIIDYNVHSTAQHPDEVL